MFRKLSKKDTAKVILFLAALFAFSCQTGVEDNPEPGIVRVTLQADPADIYIVNRSDTFSVYTPQEAQFYVNTFQGSVFSGENFAVLFRTTKSYRQEDRDYQMLALDFNKDSIAVRYDTLKLVSGADTTFILDTIVIRNCLTAAREIDRGVIGYDAILDPKLREFVRVIVLNKYNQIDLGDYSADYKQYIIFESFVPPGTYDKLRFGVGVVKDFTKSRLYVRKYTGEFISVPLEVPPDQSLLEELPVNFRVEENKVTQINVRISAFSSLTRFRDNYRFERKLKVLDVEYF